MTESDYQIDVPPPRQGIPGRLDPHALYLLPNLSQDQWMQVGDTIRFFERGVMWWLGDWWNYGERAYGEMASQAAQDAIRDRTGYDYDTVRAAGWVASRIEPVRRRTSLSWSHHREVASMDINDQDYWLNAAEQHGWGRNDLRAAIRGGDEVEVLQQIECPRCGHRWEAS